MTVYKLIKSREIPGIRRVGGQWRIHKPTIEKEYEKIFDKVA